MLYFGMTCSIDIRERVVDFVLSGGSKAEAARRYNVSRKSVYNWLLRGDLSPKKHGLRRRKLDKEELRRHVRQHPDMLLRERAEIFGISVPGLSIALKTMKIVKKKQRRYLERNNMKRAAYLCRLRKLLCAYGSDNIIYFDESGFEEDVRRDAGWAERGIKIYGDVRGGKNTRTNLIMAQRRKKQTMACADLVRRFVRRHNRLVVDQGAFVENPDKAQCHRHGQRALSPQSKNQSHARRKRAQTLMPPQIFSRPQPHRKYIRSHQNKLEKCRAKNNP
ncbi:MAG: helix-turn-helix domain-containing protein [Rhodospirillales bacterium]|nr:helix-turn-helix domain-containing protein [Rhodospirillales bacterium]